MKSCEIPSFVAPRHKALCETAEELERQQSLSESLTWSRLSVGFCTWGWVKTKKRVPYDWGNKHPAIYYTSYDPWGTIRVLMDFDSQPVFSLDVMTSNCCYKNGAWNTEYRSQFEIFWQQTQSNQNPVLHVPPTWQLDNDYSHTM